MKTHKLCGVLAYMTLIVTGIVNSGPLHTIYPILNRVLALKKKKIIIFSFKFSCGWTLSFDPTVRATPLVTHTCSSFVQLKSWSNLALPSLRAGPCFSLFWLCLRSIVYDRPVLPFLLLVIQVPSSRWGCLAHKMHHFFCTKQCVLDLHERMS